MHFYHDRVQCNAYDHLHPVLLSDFPADLRIVDADGIIRHVYRSTDQHYRESFPLFRYGVVMVTVLYLALSFSHPDYIIARVNIANAPGAMVRAGKNPWRRITETIFSPDRFPGIGIRRLLLSE